MKSAWINEEPATQVDEQTNIAMLLLNNQDLNSLWDIVNSVDVHKLDRSSKVIIEKFANMYKKKNAW
jgi:hypothetical protein